MAFHSIYCIIGIMCIFEIMTTAIAQESIDFRAAVGKHSSDISTNSDIIFLLQRSGVTDDDFENFKKFAMQGLQAVNILGSWMNETRVGLDLLTDKAQNFIDFDSCCVEMTVKNLLSKISEGFTMYNQSIVEELLMGYDGDLSPHKIDLEQSLQTIKGRYLSSGFARKKPTLILLVLNFQTPFMSYSLLDGAVDEIRGLKDAGAYVITFIADPEENRQPRYRQSGVRGRYQPRGPQQTRGIAFDTKGVIVGEDYDEGVDYFRGIFRKFQSDTQENIAFADEEEDLSRWRVKMNDEYQKLTELYAKAMSSKAEHGFRISRFSELVSPDFLQLIKDLISVPTLFFGDGELRASCPDTKNHIDKAIWSPGYYDDMYMENVDCEWRLAARKGFRVSLEFDEFTTEEAFDSVKIYDGYSQEEDEKIAEISGPLTESGDVPPVISTEQWMLVRFTSDDAFHKKGFHATWKPVLQLPKIDEATVVYLVDVSASSESIDTGLAIKWMKLATKHFVFEGGVGYNSEEPRSAITGSKFGLATFDTETHVIKHIGEPTTRVKFYDSMQFINNTHDETHLATALDYIRTNQFLYILGEDAFTEQTYVAEESETPPKRLLFLVSDGHSVDDPSQAARRLCEWDIVPVIVATKEMDEQTRRQLTSYCGLEINMEDSVAESMEKVKMHLLLPVDETAIDLLTPPHLPSLTPPTRTTTTTTTTTTPPPTTWPPWTGTLPTIKTPTTTPPAPIPDIFDYSAIAILLAAIGFVEMVSILIMTCCHICPAHPKLPLDSSKSAVMLQRKIQEHRKMKEKAEEAAAMGVGKSMSSVSLIANAKCRNIPATYSDIGDMRDSRYPEMSGSFFERGSFLPKHLQAIQDDDAYRL